MTEAPRNLLSNLLRGRIEDISGWALYHQDKLPEAADHLSRAANIIPEGTPAWRSALWHLGAVFVAMDKKEEALSSYIKSYNAGEPDAIRRGVIEQLYKKINGSLAGLDERIGAVTSGQPATEPAAQPTRQTVTNDPAVPLVQPTPPLEESKTTEAPVKASSEPAPSPEATTPPAREPQNDTPARIRETLTVAGRVRDAQGNPIGNVVVVLISPQGTVLASTTDEQGNYSFTVAASMSTRSFRIIPSKEGFTFIWPIKFCRSPANSV